MNDYQKIATIVMRGFAYYLLLWVPIEWAIIGSGSLLVNLGIFTRTSIAFEVRLLTSIVYLFAGLILLARSKSLASRMVRDLVTDESGDPDPERPTSSSFSFDLSLYCQDLLPLNLRESWWDCFPERHPDQKDFWRR